MGKKRREGEGARSWGHPAEHSSRLALPRSRLRFRFLSLRRVAGIASGLVKESDVHAEIGEVVSGKKKGREGDELILVDLTGTGAQVRGDAGE